MRRGYGRIAITAVLFATLLVPAVGAIAEDPAEQLEETRDRLNEVQEEIDALQGRQDDLQTRLKDLHSKSLELREIVAELDAKIAEKQEQLNAVQARIDATKKEMDKLEKAATDQAVALYKNGSTDTIDALLSSQSLTELDSRAGMLGQVAEENTGALIRFSRMKITIEDHYEEQYAIQQALEDDREVQEQALAHLEEITAEQETILASVEKNLDKKEQIEGNLEKEAAEITAKIQAAQAAAPAVSTPAARTPVQSFAPSATGFIWPLNNAVTSYYGPRWGRMHEGIDIDGTTGEPIVASKDGRVIIAGGYYGYGTAVVLDHGGGVSTLYGHMSSMAVGRGQAVTQGQVIGYVGCTGSCTGDHLHFEVRVNGSPQDPMAYLPG
jgi:murein DD-endopeptidase MepM/ murein hydrolase activator NlpD